MTAALLTCVHPPLSISLRHARNRARVPVTLWQVAKGVDERVWHHTMERPFPAAGVLAECERCGQGHQEKQWEDHHHQYKADAATWRDTCTAKLHIWMCRNGWGVWTSSPEKTRRSTCMEFRKYEPWKGGKNKEEIVEKAKEKTWHRIQHFARWMHLQTKPDSPLLRKNQESI